MKHSPEVENLVQQARVLRDVGRTREALPLLQRALATAPFDADLLCHLSLAYSDMGEWEESLAAAEKALSTNPISDWAHRLRSTSLRGLGRNEEALAAAYDAARYKPQHPFVLATLGYALLACKQIDEAEAIGLRMAQVAPENLKTHLLLADVSMRQQQWVNVEHHARVALQISADCDKAHFWLGEALSQQQRHWKAMEAYVSALRLNPTNSRARTAFQNQCLQIGLQQIPTNAIYIGMFVVAVLLRQWMLGAITALLVSAASALLLTAVLAYQVPMLLFLFQPEYRRLSAATRQLVMQQCRRNWLKPVGSIAGTLVVGLLFLGLLLWQNS